MKGFREVFTDWELRVYIILSLVLQILPILWTYYRRRISSHPFQRILWLTAFLAADFVATVSLGAIFHLIINPASTTDSPKNKYLLALWAPFILLHLAKHSRITTFTLAENEFWLGHFIRFIYHELTTLYICKLASNEKRVKFTAIVLFLTGTIKFGERIIAIKRGSMNELRKSTFKKVDPGFSNVNLQRYANMIHNANIQGVLEVVAIPINLVEVPHVASTDRCVRFLCAAYHSFAKHKGVYIDHLPNERDNEYVGEHSFREIDMDRALRVIKVQLGFAYDHFYTKTACFHLVWGWIVRFLNLIFIFAALILFSCIEKYGFLKADVRLTYILLVAAFVLEIESFLESMVSNRTKVQIGLLEGQKWRRIENHIQRANNLMEELRRRISRRPDTLIGQFNMLSYCFGDFHSWSFLMWMLDTFELKELWNNCCYTSFFPIDSHRDLKTRIFKRLRKRLRVEDNAPDLNSSKTLELLNEMPESNVVNANLDIHDFEKRLLVWHFATDLCYRTRDVDDDQIFHLENAKHLSEYMMYLLAIRPSMLSSITTAELKSYRNAYATCVQFYDDYGIGNDGLEVYQMLEQAYALFNMVGDEDREQHNTLLWDSFELAHELNRLVAEGNMRVWKFLFEVWVDMLSFAAANTHGKEHAERLGTGGEFITYIWLFRLHWKLGSRYQF